MISDVSALYPLPRPGSCELCACVWPVVLLLVVKYSSGRRGQASGRSDV